MATIGELVAQAARRRLNVFIVGEREADRTEAARTLHLLSPKARGPLLTVSCAAPTEMLRALEEADGGTVILAEVDQLPFALQRDLMRVVETREVWRPGTSEVRPINVRYVATAGHDLESDARAGRFRLDLFVKLSGITVTIPPEGWSPPDPEVLARMEAEERVVIEAVLARCAGSKERVAEALGLNRSPGKAIAKLLGLDRLWKTRGTE